MTSTQAAYLRAALQVGYHFLDRGSSALIAVEHTIRVLERSGLFNAGKGARLQLDGVRRMDASIMEGDSLRAGTVASIEGVVHPISRRQARDRRNGSCVARGADGDQARPVFQVGAPPTWSKTSPAVLWRDAETKKVRAGSAWDGRSRRTRSNWDSRGRRIDRWDQSHVAWTGRGYADYRMRGVCG